MDVDVGEVRPEDETIIGKLDLNQRWVRTHLPNVTSPNNIQVISMPDDSMAGTYEAGDPLFADLGVKEIREDGVYTYGLSGKLYVRRLQYRPDSTLIVISDNSKYPPYQIAARDARVIGRIVGGWNWRKL